MATVYGNTVHSDWKTYMTYTVSTTSTAVTVNINVVGIYNYSSGWIQSGYRKATLSATGKTSYTGTHNDTRISAGAKESYIKDKTYTFTRATAGSGDTTVKITAKIVWSSGNSAGTSTKSVSITVPEQSPNLAITYDANNDDAEGSMPIQYVGSGQTVNLLNNAFTVPNYLFNSWNTNAEGTGTSYSNKASFSTTTNKTLYAQWRLNYTLPQITNFIAYRVSANASGANPDVDPEGTRGFVKFSLEGGNLISLPSNTTGITITIGSSNYSATKVVNEYTYYAYSTAGVLSTANQYSVNISCIIYDNDGVGHTISDSTFISKTFVTININSEGTAVSFFDQAVDNNTTPEVAISGNFKLNGKYISDYIIEQGNTNGWIYRKWNSGISECWYKTAAAVDAQYSNLGGYDTGTSSTRYVVTPSNFPTNLFIEVPIVDCTIRGRERAFYSVPSVNPTSTSAGSWYGHRNAAISGNERAITWQFYCIGNWK